MCLLNKNYKIILTLVVGKLCFVLQVRLLPSDLLPPPTASASAFFTPAQHSLALPSMPLKLHPTCGQGVVVTNGGNSSWKPK